VVLDTPSFLEAALIFPVSINADLIKTHLSSLNLEPLQLLHA
jgi:hypothetical protein